MMTEDAKFALVSEQIFAPNPPLLMLEPSAAFGALRSEDRVWARSDVDGPYDTSPPPFNPANEAWPSGPHPGAIAQMDAEARARADAQARAAEQANIEAQQRRRTNHLLLLR